jgi:hypothetical protein
MAVSVMSKFDVPVPTPPLDSILAARAARECSARNPGLRLKKKFERISAESAMRTVAG